MKHTVTSIVDSMWRALDWARADCEFLEDVEKSFRAQAEINVQQYQKDKDLNDWKKAKKHVRRLLRLAVELAEAAQRINDPKNKKLSWKSVSKALEAVRGASCPKASDSPRFTGRWCDLGWISNGSLKAKKK